MHDQLLGLHNIHKAYRHTDDQLRRKLSVLNKLIKTYQCGRCVPNGKDQLLSISAALSMLAVALVVPFFFARAATSSSDMKQ